MTQFQHRFKHRLLLAAFCLTAALSLTYGSDQITQGNEDVTTPQREISVTAATSVEPTPGQRTAQLQAEVFTSERFKTVFGEEGFNKLLEKLDSDPERGHKSFNILSDATISYDDHRKRTLIRKIKLFMEDSFDEKNQDSNFNKLYGEFLKISKASEAVPLNRIHESSRQYFQTLYLGSKITFKDKDNGVQFGTIATIQTTEGKTFKYYVKTHSGGLLKSDQSPLISSSYAKLLDPKELLVYKILEELGVGCESHFFGRDGQHFYIATLDANTEGLFKEYSKYKDSKDEGFRKQLWGELEHVPTSVQFSEEEHQKAEVLIASDVKAQNFVYEVAKLDLLARIMDLKDCQTNSDNYGFIQRQDQGMKAKAIDFRLSDKPIEEFEKDYKSFKAFLNGNGEFNYGSTGAAMYYALHKRQQPLRVETAKKVMQTALSNFCDAVSAADRLVISKLNGITMATEAQNNAQSTVKQYADIIKANFQLFKEKLDEYGSSQE